MYFKNEWCFHDFDDTKFFVNVWKDSVKNYVKECTRYWIKTKYLPVSLKNLKFLQNVLHRHTIIPEFFENFKSIRSGCFGSGGKTRITLYICIGWRKKDLQEKFKKPEHMERINKTPTTETGEPSAARSWKTKNPVKWGKTIGTR
jgi:hypothetical protein